MKTTNKIITIGTICLLVGGIIGFFTAGRLTKKRIHQMVEMQRPPMFKQRLEEKLELTDEQKLDFDKTFGEHMRRMKALDHQMHENRSAEFNQLFGELEKGLDQKQITTIKKFKERLTKRHQKRTHRRGSGPKGPHPRKRME